MSVVSGPEVQCCQDLKQRLVHALQNLSLQTFVFGEFVHISGTLDFSIDGKQDYQVIVSEMTHPETRVPFEASVQLNHNMDTFQPAAIKTEMKTEEEMDPLTFPVKKRGRPKGSCKKAAVKVPPIAAFIDGDESDGNAVGLDEDDGDPEFQDDGIKDEDYLPDEALNTKNEKNGDDATDDTEIYEPSTVRRKRGRPRKQSGQIHSCTEPGCNYKTDHTGHFDYHMKKHRGVRDHACDECDKAFYSADKLRLHKSKAHTKNWHCNRCENIFQRKSELREHLKSEHELVIPGKLEGVACTACHAKFIASADVAKHMNEKHNHICSICGESFSQLGQLNRHTMSSHPESFLTCHECGKKFGSQGALKKHIQRHREKEHGGFPCDVCGKMFTSQGSMYHHKKGLHSGEKPYECTECDAKFAFNHSLKLHLLKHKGLRPYACKQCDKTYLTSNHLKMHVQAVHGNMKKYKCPVCDKSFPYDNSLKMHMMIHTDNRPFMCSICAKNFVSKSAMKVHEATHVEGKHFKCDICQKVYKTEVSLRAHRRRHTEDGSRFMCDICGAVFMYKSNLEAHYTVHGNSRNFQCKTCSKMFKTYATLYSHQQVHRTETPFTCHCGKAFKSKERLKAHEIRHSGLKPHQCSICNNSFPDKGGLSKHMKTVHAKVPRFACPVCKKTCNRADNLRVHMKVHNDPELFKLSLKQLSCTTEYASDDDDVSGAKQVEQGTPQVGANHQANQPDLSSNLQPGNLVRDGQNIIPQHNASHTNNHPPMDASDSTSSPGLIDLSTSTPVTHAMPIAHSNGALEHQAPLAVASQPYAQLAGASMYYPQPFLVNLGPNGILPGAPDGGPHYHVN